MALRTYRFLRLGVLVVIALLTVSVLRESFEAEPNCLQGSISAYYYTAVRAVFVSALAVLGFAMVVLWGKTWLEDAFFNLAGLLAPVVAFVPTSDTNKCLLVDMDGTWVTSEAEKQGVLAASHSAIDNNMYAYLVAVAVMLVVLVALEVLAQTGPRWQSIVARAYTFWGPWFTAAALWVVGWVVFNQDGREWLYRHTHTPAAIVMFVFIVLAVIAVGLDKHRGNADRGEAPAPRWARTYWGLAAGMAVGAAVLYLWPEAWGSPDFVAHQVFWIEAWMIAGVAAFWLLQTLDRWDDGAPPRTAVEVRDRVEVVASGGQADAAAEPPATS